MLTKGQDELGIGATFHGMISSFFSPSKGFSVQDTWLPSETLLMNNLQDGWDFSVSRI